MGVARSDYEAGVTKGGAVRGHESCKREVRGSGGTGAGGTDGRP